MVIADYKLSNKVISNSSPVFIVDYKKFNKIIVNSHPIFIVDYKTFNKKFKFYILDNCMISKKLVDNIVWEEHLHSIFKNFIKKDSIVIECGCHIGTHKLRFV